jgi:hypothetical protein
MEAEYQARAKELELAVYRTLDPRSIMALAMQAFGQNADRIGNLTITSEILSALLNVTPSAAGGSLAGPAPQE